MYSFSESPGLDQNLSGIRSAGQWKTRGTVSPSDSNRNSYALGRSGGVGLSHAASAAAAMTTATLRARRVIAVAEREAERSPVHDPLAGETFGDEGLAHESVHVVRKVEAKGRAGA